MEKFTDQLWRCRNCKNTFPLIDGIPSFLPPDSSGSRLEEIDYDKVHSINADAISSIGASWHTIINELGKVGENAIEIGAGTGALTLGLLKQKTFSQIVATDISLRFLSHLKKRGDIYKELEVIACDANCLNLCDESFSTFLGRSILHHLVDYKVTLGAAFRILRPGGAAIFFEPILQGKVFIALFAKLLLKIEQQQGNKILGDSERNKISIMIRHITKSKWYPQDRESLQKLEDKYIFDLDLLNAQAKAIGFSEVIFKSDANESIDTSYWSYFVRHLGVLGVKPDEVANFHWIGESFAETYGLLFGDRMVAPMGFFIFKK